MIISGSYVRGINLTAVSSSAPPPVPPVPEPTAFWINTAKNDTGNQWVVNYRLALGESVKDANGNVYSIASYSKPFG